jgi:hypothetical protein
MSVTTEDDLFLRVNLRAVVPASQYLDRALRPRPACSPHQGADIANLAVVSVEDDPAPEVIEGRLGAADLNRVR